LFLSRIKMNLVIKLFFTLLFGAYLLSCNDNENNPTTSNKNNRDTLIVDVGFPSTMATFTYKGASYYYFYDLVSYKKIAVYDKDLKLIKTYSLSDFVNSTYDLIGLEMITPDSALILTDYTSNMLISIDLKTKKNKKVYLNKLLSFKDNETVLEFWPTCDGAFVLNNRLALSITPSVSKLNMDNSFENKLEGMRMYDSLYLSLPYYIFIDQPFSDSPKLTLMPKSKAFVNKFENAMHNGLNSTYFHKDRLIFTHHYLDFFDIHYLDGREEQKPLKSVFSDISVTARKWSDLEKNPEELNFGTIDFKNAGRVSKIFYNAKKDQFNVILLHSKKRNPDPDGDVTPFIWQVYDKNFVLLSEEQWSPTNIIAGSAVASKSDVYFIYYNEDTYDPNKKVLVRFPL
jgi:hypothetical protein